MSSKVGIVASGREASDSVDFHARHGRTLHARAAREGVEALIALYRSWQRRGAARDRGWQVEWPTPPRMSLPNQR